MRVGESSIHLSTWLSMKIKTLVKLLHEWKSSDAINTINNFANILLSSSFLTFVPICFFSWKLTTLKKI